MSKPAYMKQSEIDRFNHGEIDDILFDHRIDAWVIICYVKDEGWEASQMVANELLDDCLKRKTPK
jgi:hypothetical protein